MLNTSQATTNRTVTVQQAKDWARAALERGDLAESQVVANQLLSAVPKDPEALLAVAAVEYNSGRFSVAKALGDSAYAIAPYLGATRSFKQQIHVSENHRLTSSYIRDFLVGRSRHADYPSDIYIETVGHCNARCNFCPHEDLDRRFETMSDELFEKIIREVSVIPTNVPLNFAMNVINETFMDKKIFERIGLINSLIPHATLNIYTNLNVRPPHFLEKLRKVQNLIFFNVSLNAANEVEYRERMGIDFGKTITNVRDLLNDNRKHRYLVSPVRFSRIGTGDERDAQFERECRELFADYEYGHEYRTQIITGGDWVGGHVWQKSKTTVPFLMPCQQWHRMTVLSNGVVPLCCQDAKGEFQFGNVKEQSLLDIYNSPKFRSLRDAVPSRETVYPCNACVFG